MAKALDLIGQKFGKLTPIERLPSRNGKTYWLCKCECGNYTQVQTTHLRSGATKGCGCLHTIPIKKSIMESISDEEFKQIVESSSTYKEITERCGYSSTGGSQKIIKDRIEKQNLNFISSKTSNKKREDSEVFCENSEINQSTLRRRYRDNGYTEYKCSICGLEPFWNGKELTLTLDHINGHNHDNRLENLRWVCPNCDRQLDTFGAKNFKNKREN